MRAKTFLKWQVLAECPFSVAYKEFHRNSDDGIIELVHSFYPLDQYSFRTYVNLHVIGREGLMRNRMS